MRWRAPASTLVRSGSAQSHHSRPVAIRTCRKLPPTLQFCKAEQRSLEWKVRRPDLVRQRSHVQTRPKLHRRDQYPRGTNRHVRTTRRGRGTGPQDPRSLRYATRSVHAGRTGRGHRLLQEHPTSPAGLPRALWLCDAWCRRSLLAGVDALAARQASPPRSRTGRPRPASAGSTLPGEQRDRRLARGRRRHGQLPPG